jgi:DNA replication licensing factor MCM6
MVNEEKVALFVDFTHLLQFRFDESSGFNFVTSVVKEYHRFEPFLRKAITQFMSDIGFSAYCKDRIFQIGYYNMPAMNKIRDLKVQCLGRLMSVHGTVTRTTEVKPELIEGAFKCQECGEVSTGVEQQFKFTEPIRCVNEKCSNRTKWELLNTDSQFIDW